MKVWIVIEGATDEVILRRLLPDDMLSISEFLVGGGRSAVPSLARTLLVKYRDPVVVLLDTESLDGSVIHELVTTMNELLRAVAGNTPFRVVYCIPEMECIFFDSQMDLSRLFPEYDNQFLLMVSKFNPKGALEFLFKNGGGPTSLQQLLAALNREDIEKLRTAYPVRQLMEFISEVQAQGRKQRA